MKVKQKKIYLVRLLFIFVIDIDIINRGKMRIFVTAPDETGTFRKTRLTLVDCTTTHDFLKRISALCNVHANSMIVKVKQQHINLRIIQGWLLQRYPIRQGSEVLVEILPEAKKNKSPIISPAKLLQIQQQLQLEIEDNSTTGVQQKLSFFSDSTDIDMNKYFEDSLEQFLDAVRKQNLQQAARILKAQPQSTNQKALEKIMRKKTSFLLNQIGECGRGAIHWAIQENNLQMVEFLLIKTSDPNLVTIDEYTPLQLSIVLKASSIFQTLVSHPRIDLNKVTKKGTALHLSIQSQLLTYAQKLIDLGANPQVQNLQGITSIQLCNKLNVKKLKFRNIEESYVQVPHIIRGNLNRVSSFASRLKPRLLIINPFKNQLIVFEQKTIQHSFAVKSIEKVQEIKNKGWGMKKEYFYFEISCIDLSLTFCVKNRQIGNRWVTQLLKGVAYTKKKEKQLVPIQEQLIQVLDDETNTIKVHKLKIAEKEEIKKKQRKNSNKLDIMNLKPTEQNQNQNQEQGLKISSLKQKTIKMQKKSSQKSVIFEQVVEQVINSQNEIRLSIPNSVFYSQEEYQPDYLRESQLLGSVLNNSMLNRSPQGSPQLIRNSSMEEKFRPIVCFKDFDILRELGSGSFGKVFLARHRKNQKLLALKVLNKKKLLAKKQLKYAVAQANILKRIENPFIIKLHYSFQTPSNLYIAMDYCPNGDLSQLLSEDERLNQYSCKFYIAQVILAIQYLHRNKIIYRDLKPENVLIGEDGFIRLADFNLSKQNNFSMSFCGSPAYLSPEMLEKKGVGFEVDIYGIGCVLYEMLVGEPPFFDQNMNTLYDNIRNGKLKFPSWIGKQAKSIIAGLLDRNTKKRLGVSSIRQIKQHEYFKGFDWGRLQRYQMKLPLDLETKFSQKLNNLQVIQQNVFKDQDYEQSSNMINRIKNFTFVRQTN